LADSVVAFHGFTQRGSAWDEVAARLQVPVVAPDLPGHGPNRALGWDAAARWAIGVIESAPQPTVATGYSMGGRLALAAVLERPAIAEHLVLVSSSAGIADAGERTRRRAGDGALARWIEREGTAAFLDDWLERPMFAGLQRRGDAWRAADRAAREGSDPARLAAALRGLGPGMMPYLGGRLGELRMPVTLVVGERDPDYVAAAREMAAVVPRARLVVIPDAGHAVVGEAPEAVAEVLREVVANEHVFD
jgi:2-succinyl-6-hydroxy-2,4-cyclohexadiene-1-carboxylate synthase